MQTVVGPLTGEGQNHRAPPSLQKSYKIKSKNLTFSLTRGPGAISATITYGQTGQIEMEVINEAHVKFLGLERGKESESERENGREKISGGVKMFIFHTSKFPAQFVCVFKINRPCDEQPVPRWKYIL